MWIFMGNVVKCWLSGVRYLCLFKVLRCLRDVIVVFIDLIFGGFNVLLRNLVMFLVMCCSWICKYKFFRGMCLILGSVCLVKIVLCMWCVYIRKYRSVCTRFARSRRCWVFVWDIYCLRSSCIWVFGL